MKPLVNPAFTADASTESGAAGTQHDEIDRSLKLIDIRCCYETVLRPA
jgi:hypothetical protein